MSSVQFLIDKTLGKYKVLEHVGHGGMSEVYKGEHVELGRMVAVKVLHPFLADEEGFVVRFKREARIVATLRQHNIVQVYDFDYNDELSIYYMVMEFIDGPTLKSLLNNGPLPVDEAVRIGIAICEALDYAHERGMVHRDVKPANIMFIPDGEPVLTDFGIAKMLSLSELTASGAMVGTPAYMAPEVGIGKVGTSASDIYSMGVVLYQMVTGRLPFESDSPMGMVMQHINDTPPPLSKIMPSVPLTFESVVLRAMEKQPEMRFECAGDMAAALRRVFGGAGENGNGAVAAPPVVVPVSTVPERYVTTSADDDDDDRLLRTWPSANQAPPLSTPTHFPKPQPLRDTPVAETVPSKPRWRFLRVLSAIIAGFVLGVAGFLGWREWGRGAPIALAQLFELVQERQSLPRVTVVQASMTPTPEFTATVTPEPTSTPVTVTPTPTPNPVVTQPTPATCDTRLKLNHVRIEPDDVVAPGADFVAYISLQNNGDCRWPMLSFVFDSGTQMTEEGRFPVAQIGPNETVQLLLPMQAPAEIGVYESLWTVQLATGNVVGISIAVTIEVGDVLAPTPTPPEAEPTAVAAEPLALDAPVLLEWDEDVARSLWSGTLALEATGGAGSYRYYRGDIREDTLLPDGRLTFEWRRCEALPVSVWVVSGDEVVSWDGIVEYPDPERCQ